MDQWIVRQNIRSTNWDQSGKILDKSVLVVDRDRLHCDRLALGLSSRGFTARTAMSVSNAMAAIKTAPPAFAVIDLRLGDGSGFDVIEALMAERADARGVILTDNGSVASAVMAMKIGAFDYLIKPANADEVVNALIEGRPCEPTEHEPPMSADRVRWEHIQRAYEVCEHNVSDTAKRLNMHRRTLQRILAKRAPKDRLMTLSVPTPATSTPCPPSGSTASGGSAPEAIARSPD